MYIWSKPNWGCLWLDWCLDVAVWMHSSFAFQPNTFCVNLSSQNAAALSFWSLFLGTQTDCWTVTDHAASYWTLTKVLPLFDHRGAPSENAAPADNDWEDWLSLFIRVDGHWGFEWTFKYCMFFLYTVGYL